jgi:hypothetical protein
MGGSVERNQEHTEMPLQCYQAQLTLIGNSNVVAVSLLNDLQLPACGAGHKNSRWTTA